MIIRQAVKKSVKREPGQQISIPKEYYDSLKLGDKVEMVLVGDELRLRRTTRKGESFDNYSDLILESVLEDGYINKEDIVNEFRKRVRVLPLAAQDMVNDAKKIVMDDQRTSEELDKELFGED